MHELSSTQHFRRVALTSNILQLKPIPSLYLLFIIHTNAATTAIDLLLSQDKVASAPQIVGAVGSDPNSKYTLIMYDPDVCKNQGQANVCDENTVFRHWVISDIPGAKEFSGGTTEASYYGPTPPANCHRYFLEVKSPTNM